MSEILSISLPKELLDRIERMRVEKGYNSRSEVVRDALKLLLSRYEPSRGLVLSSALVLTNSEERKSDQEISRLLHEFSDVIIQFNHTHIGDFCVESFTCVGDSERVDELLSKLRRVKGIIEVRDVRVSLEEK